MNRMKKEHSIEEILDMAAERIRQAKYLTAFSGAGISVESGIPPFRGPGGIWDKYDPASLDLDLFRRHPEQSWPVIREMFTCFLGAEGRPPVQPNAAHRVLAKWEREGRLQVVITQNIDGLHAAAAVPVLGKQGGATIIGVNPEPSDYTARIADFFLPLKAGKALSLLNRRLAGGG